MQEDAPKRPTYELTLDLGLAAPSAIFELVSKDSSVHKVTYIRSRKVLIVEIYLPAFVVEADLEFTVHQRER